MASHSLHNFGEAARLARDYTTAQPLYEQALDLYRDLGYEQGVALTKGHPERAVRLLGSADALLETASAPLFPIDAMEHDRTLSAARQRLTKKVGETAWEGGRAMTVEQVIAYAMAEGNS